ncbi:Matrix metalloproteinase-16 like protein [Argiope bruennichi]|uniref:Matrix metalloproteinase-16 like protein n=1 Tax=Argiope bruennichi TaxID=94029 RepID=A0A8T0E765_ARGBR|nr:Matrix metalloproteinase-16 like protein [Argiope bruennichi]
MISLPGLHRKARIGTRIRTWIVILAALFLATQAAPLSNSRDLVKHWDAVQSYLNQYGYLRPSPDGADNLRTEDKLREAIRRMQRYGGVSPTGIVDGPTLALLKKKRCGMQDLTPGERVRRYAVQGQQWPKKDLTWSIKLWPSSLSSDLVRAEVTKAFKVWSDVSQLTFREVQRLDADIVVSFERGKHGDGYAFDGRGVVLAHAFFPGDGIGGDAHFDAEEPWVDREMTGIDGVRLFAVAAHEFGHSLGLSHSSVSGALMNPFYQQINDNFQLPYDDTIGIQKLYGPRNPNRWAPLSPYIPPATRAPPYFWRLNNNGLMKDYPVESKAFLLVLRDLEHWMLSMRDPLIPKSSFSQVELAILSDGAPTFSFTFLCTRATTSYYPPALSPDSGLPPLGLSHVRPTPQHPKNPHNAKRSFDAVVTGIRRILHLKGKYFWRLNNNGLMKDYPVEIKRFWYDSDLETVDAVYERPIDTKIVFFSGRTYFFKGRKFWEFSDNLMKVVPKFRNANQYWFGCPSRNEEAPNEEEDGEEGETDALAASKSGLICAASNCVTLISIAVTILLYRTRCALY